ncbi:MAG: helix-turn-helix transcriptional regulator [Clostridia bacterium]|nr:helix-turn-helix transcriptional regulator [Clostridia bacterium]
MKETVYMINKTIGLNIKATMKDRKLKQCQLAKKAGLSTTQISNIINAKEGSSIQNYLGIAQALGVSFFDLINTKARNCSNCGNFSNCRNFASCPKNNFNLWGAE